MPHERLAGGGAVRLGEGRGSNLLESFAEILLADLLGPATWRGGDRTWRDQIQANVLFGYQLFHILAHRRELG